MKALEDFYFLSPFISMSRDMISGDFFAFLDFLNFFKADRQKTTISKNKTSGIRKKPTSAV
jgi:hypothetical protein